jgi:hypothetical protein
MTRRERIGLTVAIVVVTICVAVVAFGYLVFIRGSISSQALGGAWFMEYRSTPSSHGGASMQLYRKESGHRRNIYYGATTWQYLGDDCLAYSAPPDFVIACGDRPPAVMATRGVRHEGGEPVAFVDYRLEREGLREVVDPSGQAKARLTPYAQWKQTALGRR